MSETFARDAQERTLTGGVLIATASAVAACLVVLAVYALAFMPRQHGSPAPAGSPATVAARYLAIAAPANRRMLAAEHTYLAEDRRNLAAARAALTAQVATAAAFDRSLVKIAFPAKIEAMARALIGVDQRRGALITRQARSATLRRMRSFNGRHRAADAAVAAEASALRRALHLPPAAGG